MLLPRRGAGGPHGGGRIVGIEKLRERRDARGREVHHAEVGPVTDDGADASRSVATLQSAGGTRPRHEPAEAAAVRVALR
jgi:hypothetical protein